MSLWGGRFESRLDPAAWALNTSLAFDRRLAPQDVRGSLAWARGLGRAGLLTTAELAQIETGLQAIAAEIAAGTFVFYPHDEDIHSAVERRLGELIGPAAGKLHTGRSRNDQVATDLRLWLLDSAPMLAAAMAELQRALAERAEQDLETLLPGYTHLQRAQPITLGHWWLSFFWPLQRDRQRLAELTRRAATLPLGSGALAGAPFPIDRQALAAELGCTQVSENSLDGVSDRDFVAEFLFCASLTGAHLSRLAEAVVLFTSAEFAFFELSDAFATGSSLMPQKKNPDIFELARGKAGTLLGLLTGWLATLKGLPSTYDKDLQEDKLPLFAAYDTLLLILPALSGAVRTLTVNADRMRAAIDPALMATDLADYLVRRGIPFRAAHEIVGRLVRQAEQQGAGLDQLPLAAFQDASPQFGPDVYQAFDPSESVARRNIAGGAAPQAVRAQLAQAYAALETPAPF